MDESAREAVIHFGNKEIEKKEVKKEIAELLEQNDFLSETQRKQLTLWASQEIGNIIKRRSEEHGEVSSEFKNSTLNYVLGKLEGHVRSARIFKERERKERLNPQLATKSEMREVILTRAQTLANTGEVLVLVNIDLDDFKTVNDSPGGHPAGDNVLRSFGQALGEAIRGNDIAAHYSGDEFGILLQMPKDSDTSATIQDILKRIIETVQESTTRPDTKIQELSVGYRVIEATDISSGLQPEHFVSDADKGVEVSKKLRILAEGRGNSMESADRIVDAREAELRLGEYLPKEIQRATAIRAARRGFMEAYPDIPSTTLTELTQNFIINVVEPELAKLRHEATTTND